MDYFKKYNENPYEDLKWNIPERKQGTVAVVGGNMQNFRTPVRIAEWLGANYPVEAVKVVLPDALKDKLPPLPDLVFLKSTESGSFADAEEILAALDTVDYGLVIGDLSRHNVTAKVVAEACGKSRKPLIIMRDAVDLMATEVRENMLMNENLVFVASMAQLQKLFKAVYYPKMLMMTQPLMQVAEALHKFTLSYPVKIITLQDGQILTAMNGEVAAVALEKSGYSPLTLWSGELTAKIVAYNLYSPDNFMKATVCAIFA